MRRVRVRWEDHAASAVWTTIGERPTEEIAESEGRVVYECDKWIVLAVTISGNEYNASQIILKTNIIGEIEELA